MDAPGGKMDAPGVGERTFRKYASVPALPVDIG